MLSNESAVVTVEPASRLVQGSILSVNARTQTPKLICIIQYTAPCTAQVTSSKIYIKHIASLFVIEYHLIFLVPTLFSTELLRLPTELPQGPGRAPECSQILARHTGVM